MYGRYSRSLGEYARQQAAELRELEKKRKKEEKLRSKELHVYRGKWTSRFLRAVSFVWRHTFAKIGEVITALFLRRWPGPTFRSWPAGFLP